MNWISVKDKLPEKGQRVLCVQNPKTTATKEALFAFYDGKNFLPPEPFTIFANFERGFRTWNEIIYWQPLPKPPEKE